MQSTFLFVGDIHLGRRPTGLPDVLESEHGIRPAELTPAVAFAKAVNLAIERGVDAVVMAGDVVEGLDDRFEAWNHLDLGVRRLVDAEIPIYAVAGNHDVHALPRLADRIPSFRLLGRGGVWEMVDVPCRSGQTIRLVGWSFPARRVTQSPVEGLRLDARPEVPTIGVLHCDVDAGGSDYAPVSSSALAAAPVDAWFLGHIHKPDALTGPRPIGYLGSLVGLDPGEPGRHGPWLVTVDGPGSVSAEQVALGPIRWERGAAAIDDIELDEASDPKDRLFDALVEAMRAIHQGVAGEGSEPLAIGCRLALTGRSRWHRELRRAVADLRPLPCERLGDAIVFVEKVADDARAAVDLAALAVGTTPPALLARRLLALEQMNEEGEAILERARRAIPAAVDGLLRHRVDARAADPARLREALLRAGLDALDELLAQPGEGAAP